MVRDKVIFSFLCLAGLALAAAERTVWFEDDCEGRPQIAFQNISEPTVYGRKAALATGKIRIDREGYTDISEMRSHAGVHAFVLDVTLDGLSGKWGGRATWGSTVSLAIPADRPVYLTAFVRTEILSPEIAPELAVLFDGKDGKGNPVHGGCLQFKPEGQDPNGWLVFSKDVVAHIRKRGFVADKITGWRLVLNGPSGRPLKKARALLYVDDITFASAPPKIPALSKLGEEAKYQKIEPGPHTVGYMSLYDRFPQASHNRTWNSSFENGFDRWSGGIAPMDADLHIADSAKAVRIVRGDSVHGDCHVEMGDPEGRVSSVSLSTLPFPIKEGRRYTLSFYAKSSQPGAILTAEGCGIYGKYALTGAWKRYVLDIPKMVCFNRGAGRQYPGRWKFSLVHRGTATVSVDAVQVEEGPLTAYAYPPLVSVAVHSHHDLGILGATDAPEAYVTVFNGFDAATNAVLETEVRNFRHDSVLKARQSLVLGPHERREIPISFVGAEKLRHWKLTARVWVDGVVEQEARGAICRVDDVRDLPGADYFGQLGYAGTTVGNFDRVLQANRLLGVKRMIVYNNFRRDWEDGWQTNALYDARRDLYIDAVLRAGFVPELAIYPFARSLKLEKETDAHILTDAAIADVDAWVRRLATHLRGRVSHYEVFGEYMRGEMTRRAQNVATLLPVISKALRECAPGCEITAFAEDNMPNICGELEPHFRLGSLNWCDNVSLHPYCVGNENQEILDDAEPAVRRLIDRYAPAGRKIPFSCGEAGHRGVDTLYWDEAESESMYYPIHCTELEYAERMVREIVIGMTHGFSRYIAFYTTCEGFFSFNYLQYGDGDRQRPKTVFTAFNNLVKRLAGFSLVKSFADRDRKLRGATFSRGNRAVAVVWHYPDDHKPTNARLRFDPKRLRGCNVVGEEFVPTGRNGETEFALDGSPVFFETDASAADELAVALAALEVDYTGKDTGRFPIARIAKPAGDPFSERLSWPSVELGERHRVSRGLDSTPYGGKEDLSAVVRGASDGERLYLDVEVTDDMRQTPYDADHDKMLIWSNDALQMAFDRADGTGLKEINFSAPPAGEVFFTVANEPIREELITFKARTEGVVTTYRIVIPWKALWADFASGDETRVKFCVAVVDNDGARGNPKLQKFGDRQALQLAPGLYVGGKQSADYPKLVPIACAADPTGCPSFTVEKPRVCGSTVVKAVDFGFATANDDNGAALQRALAEAARLSADTVELAPGTYRCFSPKGIAITGRTDFTLDGKGATLVFRRPLPAVASPTPQWAIRHDDGCVVVKDCVRTHLKDFNVDWDWASDPLASKARVIAVHAETPSYVDFDLPDGHPAYPEPVPMVVAEAMDATFSRFRNGPGHFFAANGFGGRGLRNEWIGPKRLRVHFPANACEPASRFDVGGAYRLLHSYYGDNAFTLDSNRHLTVSRINVFAARGMAFHVSGKQRYWRLEDCSVAPPAGSGRVISSTADANHVAQSCGYCQMVNFKVNLNSDDCNNFHDRTTIAVKRGVRGLRVVNTRGPKFFGAKAGDRIELLNADFSPVGWNGRIVKVMEDGYEMDRETPKESTYAFVLANREYGTDNILLSGCEFVDATTRTLIHGCNVTIENCTWKRTGATPLRFLAVWTKNAWCEGTGCRNVVVRNCNFEEDNVWRWNVKDRTSEIVSFAFTPERFGEKPGENVPEVTPWNGAVADILVENCVFTNPIDLTWQRETGTNLVSRGNRVVRTSKGANGNGQSPWPFLTIRQTSAAPAAGERFTEIIAASARHPGSADEYWLCFNAGPSLGNAQARMARWQPFLPLLEAAHITAGSQQGVTLGHSSVDVDAGVFPDDAWQVDRKGVRLKLLCPRAPEVLAYEADLVERAVRTMKLKSVWLDDDLRMGGGKEEGCFCNRCLAAFNREYGLNVTREELVARLDSKEPKEELRRQWRLFKNLSLAVYGAAARRGADRASPNVRLGYQSIDAQFLTAGENYLPLLKELAGTNGVKSAIRVGSGNYFESITENYRKSFSVMREAERCRPSDFVAQVSYEQETYTREVLHKSAEAVLTESAMALAAGADALTEYWWTASRDEPTSYFEEFSAMLVEWRPYLESLAAISRETSLAGLARFRGSDHLSVSSSYLGDGDDFAFGSLGIPMTVDESSRKVWYVNAHSLNEWGAGDAERLAAKGAVVDKAVWTRLLAYGGEPVARAAQEGRLVPFDFTLVKKRQRTLPTHAEREAFLDAIEKVAALPVRIERAHPLYVFPRVDAEGRVRAVSLFNGSVGRCLPTDVVIRNPASETVVWGRPGESPWPLAVEKCAGGLKVRIPGIPGASVGTLILSVRAEKPTEGCAVDPETVFRHPPQAAKTGVWWHWMGTGVSREGIVRDLDWFRDMGIGSVTIFAMTDSVLPGALELTGGPMPDLVAATPAWWRLVRFATEEAVKRGIEVGLHNCPGYTHTGGPWIKPQHAMRDLVFEIPGKTAVTNHVDKRAIATIDVNGEKVVVSHVAKRSYNNPAQKGATGYECDKMSAEAVNAHWDRVLGDVKEHLGDLIGKGFNFLHADSYEAKRPSWTPKMREEFTARRGYDPVPLLPVLAGMDCCPPEKAKAFKADFLKTIRELYRDNIFRLSAERLHAVGLEFCSEPYGDASIDTAMCGVYADRLMTEFWTGGEPWEKPMPPPEQWTYRMNWTDWTRVRDGRHPNVIGAEAFTGWPESSRWTETPSRLKRVGDYRYVTGINHFVLHSVPLQPWGDGIRPGMTFGCWGTHFGRTQTWARDGKAWFDYLNRCQALLQWGAHASSRDFPLAKGLAQCVRRQGPVAVRFIVNAAESDVVFSESGEWFDPVAGTVGAPPSVLVPGQSGFLVTGRPGKVALKNEAAPVPLMTVRGPWAISWKSAALGAAPIPETDAAAFFEWTTSDNPEIRHFSGTATYRTTFDCAEPNKAAFLSVGDIQGQMARVRLNGTDLGVVWCAPTRVAVPPGLVKKTGNLLEIDYTNTWANRLIGDEAYPPLAEWKPRRCLDHAIGASPLCYPAFLASGRLPEGTKRSTFSMWNYFSAESPLVPAGLLGPVGLLDL